MKRIGIALVVSALASLAFAQAWGGGAYGPMGGRFGGPGYGYAQTAPQAAPQTKTLDGSLVFVDQVPALKTKDATYILRMPGFYRTAYIDGIKEGATMKLEGYDLGNVPGQANPYFFVTKATVNGKTYDLSSAAGFGRRGDARGAYACPGVGNGYGPGPGYGMMGGRW